MRATGGSIEAILGGSVRPLSAAVVVVALTVTLSGLPATVARPAAAVAPAGLSRECASRPSNSVRHWWLMSRGAHERPSIPASAARLLHRYSGVWAGPRREKVIYLTFDEADEIGTTRRIIGILGRAHVKASFFLTGRYMRADPGLTRSLTRHGHLVCNHSFTHPSMAAKAGHAAAFAREIHATERAFRAATGERLAPFFRPPYGTYSARCLMMAERLGYTTVFWSFAHVDWELGDQPPVGVTLARLFSASHRGAIYLLHAASPSNVNALARAIRGLKSQGYRFATLEEIK